MKKLNKFVFAILPMLALSACGTINHVEQEQNVQLKNDALLTTYLVLGENGRLDNQKGQDVPDKFLENTIAFQGKAGETLPVNVTNTVSNVKFVSWIAYEGNGKPNVYDKVTDDGKILYAFYKHEGAITPKPPVPPTPPVEKKVTILVDDVPSNWETVKIHAWNDGGSLAKWPGTDMVKDGNHWKFDLSTKYTNFLFTASKDGPQTGNLSLSDVKENKNCYHIQHGTWGVAGETLGEVKPAKVYCEGIPTDWNDSIYCYAWQNNNKNHDWPGLPMEKVGDRYMIEMPNFLTKVIFHDTNNHKTADLDYTFNQELNCYNITTGAWSKVI